MDAVSLVRHVDVDAFVAKLLKAPVLGVRMWALVEMTRRQVSGARDLVYARLGWDEFDHDSFRGAYEAVFDALGVGGAPDPRHSGENRGTPSDRFTGRAPGFLGLTPGSG
jgi:hypothetical protein